MNERDALRGLTNEVNGLLGIADQGIGEAVGWTNLAVLKDKIAKAEQALEAPSEMQQLVEWMEDTRDFYIKATTIDAKHNIFNLVLDHIRTKFLGEEGKW